MASLWELLDLGSLTYDTERGWLFDDAGAGPPAGMGGWVRTGVPASTGGGAKYANCGAWTDTGATSQGSMVRLNPTWAQAPTVAGPWQPSVQYCTQPERVWCVQD